MSELAQTNVQLCRQVVALGWGDADLAQLRSAYELAMWMFSGQFRANGKTQIAHHVGVASALAQTAARPTLVVGGLVHSAYFLGEFGSGRVGPDPDKRTRLVDTVGVQVEALVDAYTEQPWNADAVRTLRDDAAPSSIARDVVAMRLANEVDEWSDASARWTNDQPEPGLAGHEGLDQFVELARAYELAPLGDLLGRVAQEADATAVPDALVTSQEHTVFVPPASYRRRLHIALQDSRLGHEVAARVPGARSLAERIRRAVS
jgi:hypothetical protein